MSLILDAVGLVTGIASESERKKAEQAADEEKIRAYQYNIERVKEETAGQVGDIKREGAAYTRGQSAAIGASGAEIGSGTPLMAMIETASSIERDITRVKRAAQLETEYYQGEIEAIGGTKEQKELRGKLKKTSPWGPGARGKYSMRTYGGGPGAR